MILESKSPTDYIDRSLKARISPAAKAKLARLWMESTGYTKDDILRARNRHPYWKRKKMEGSAERTRKRLAEHDYSSGSSVQWDSKLVADFLELNRRGDDGRYEWKDWQLAEHFGATIPSIQYMRRKLSKVQSLVGNRAPQGKVVDYLLRAESVLARGKSAVEAVRSSKVPGGEASKAKAPAKKAKAAAPIKKAKAGAAVTKAKAPAKKAKAAATIKKAKAAATIKKAKAGAAKTRAVKKPAKAGARKPAKRPGAKG